jgi:predicted PurR-regulated permease PerM
MTARSLQPPITVLAGIVLVTAAIVFAQGVFVTVAFGALAAVICRRLQLVLVRRGAGNGLAITLTVTAFVVVLAALVLAGFAAVAVVVAEISASSDELTTLAEDVMAQAGAAVGLPPPEVPPVDIATVVSVLRSALGMLMPVLSGLFMAVLIVAYLLIDARRLRERMLAITSPGVMARYDALEIELVTYIKVRAVLGGAAAIADTILLLVLGVPYAPLWGVLSFLFSFVPNLGFIIALIPPTVFAFLDGGLAPAVLVVVGYVAINLAFDYVLQPRMMETELDISPVVTIVAILVWTLLVGPMGALLAVPLTITVRAILLPYPGARWFVALLGPLPDDPVAASQPGDPAPEPSPSPAPPS